MPDGCRLAARIWLPENSEKHPVPAILEYIPYRKNDGTAIRDSIYHPYFAGYGYAAVRVDMRGSGDSDGVMLDEYLPQELEDAVSVIAWLAEQPWCDGTVGMMGKSWGGFNSLQVAALRPPSLKAIITVCSTDDRYSDDVHYKGGCILTTDMLGWATTMLAWNARPPDPEVLGDVWREKWLDRLEQTPCLIKEWLNHPLRDSYWKHGSICEDFSAVKCAVYAVGGWADPYSNAIPRLLSGLSCPRKGLIGPWAHEYPQRAFPAPQIGFAQECLRWWDYWLKGRDTGIMNEPVLRVWMEESIVPKTFHEERPGRWVAEPNWPPENLESRCLYLCGNGLTKNSNAEEPIYFPKIHAVGFESGMWFPMGIPGDFPGDQRLADSRSLCFTSEPLAEGMEILGNPEIKLVMTSDKPEALLAVRLCDVAPDGTSLLVSWGLLNLTHRNGHESAEPLIPGEQFNAALRLNACAHALKQGHRWRIALSSSYTLHAWCSPEPVELAVLPGEETCIHLPFRTARPEDAMLPDFDELECSPPLENEIMRSPCRYRTVKHDLIEDCFTLAEKTDSGRICLKEDGLEIEDVSQDTVSIIEGDPLSLIVSCKRSAGIVRDDWQCRADASGSMTATSGQFHVTSNLEVFEGEERVFARNWEFSIPRNGV